MSWWIITGIVGLAIVFVVAVCAIFAWFGYTLEKVMKEEG